MLSVLINNKFCYKAPLEDIARMVHWVPTMGVAQMSGACMVRLGCKTRQNRVLF